MSVVSWPGSVRFARALLAEKAGGATGEILLRLGLAAAAELSVGLEPAAPVPQAVVVVGHQRSGTTWLHRLLSAQPGACSMDLADLLFPGALWSRVRAVLRASPRLRGLQDRHLATMDPIHVIRLHLPEEDEFLLMNLFRSPTNALDRPWGRVEPPHMDVDEQALRIWARMVAGHVQRQASGMPAGAPLRWYVGKNPHFTWRIPALRRALPGVGVVQLVRHPAEAIASRLSLIRAIWRLRHAGFQDLAPAQVERIYANSCRCYLLGDGQADLDVAYEELVADPGGVRERVLRRFGLLQEGSGEAVTARTGARRHTYDLEAFGLTRQRLAVDLAPIYQRWGFSP